MSLTTHDIKSISIHDFLAFTDAYGVPRQSVVDLIGVSQHELDLHAKGKRSIPTQYVEIEESENALEVERIDDEEGTIITLHRDFYDGGPEFVFLALSPENAARLGTLLIQLAAQPN